jgi:two-component system chemotaxis sensor kinase CheA
MAITESLQQELVKDLLVESHEGLDRYDREILSLEQGQGNKESMNIIFRVIHTLKGTAGCLGLAHIEHTAHVGEDLLSLLRDGKLQASPEITGALLALSDAIRGMLRTLEATGSDGEAEHGELLNTLVRLQAPEASAAAPAARIDDAAFGLFSDEDDPPAAPPGTEAHAPAPKAPADAGAHAPHPSAPDLHGKASVADNAIRVDISQLDKVMNLVGELVLARNQIIASTAQADPVALATASQRLNIITTELQESVMKTRMQPIGNVWGKFPRIVRDVAHELNKRVRLVMDGQNTELDRTIIEAIKDPLTHIVRNSIDHGIELPAKRAQAGKPEEGLLSLRAYHEGGQVNIEIMDDGGGINVERVKAKALSQSLITAEQAARMSEREALSLIFAPGLSTAEKVTNVSGRGVGMDVVKTNIEKIGGSIDIHSQAGQGTTIKIKIPLTLAIIPALIVTSGGDRYAIPQVSLLELVRLEGDSAKTGIENLYGAPFYRLRGQLMPLAYLNNEFKASTEADDDEPVNIIVLQADGRSFGLIVDEINDTEEIVVKPLGKQLKGLSCFAGATIMGDGRVALILDVVGLAQHANVLDEARSRAQSDEKATIRPDAQNKQSLLLFSVGRSHRMAIPLSLAARLEEIPSATVERTGAQDVIQYRGQILPLIHVEDHVAGGRARGADLPEMLKVVVCSENGASYGLVVGEINDIVDEVVAVRRNVASRGILGSAVIQDKVTDFLDVQGIIRAADTGLERTAA